MFYDVSPAKLAGATRDHFLRTPSETSLILFAVYTGPDVPAPLPDSAFSMSARVYGGPWTMWTEPPDDASNIEWHLECVDLLAPLSVGHYVGESDIVRKPEFAEGAYSADKWAKLAKLRERYDPDGVFFGYSDGF
jgi:FAD/FMN-containing dehydrogenase